MPLAIIDLTDQQRNELADVVKAFQSPYALEKTVSGRVRQTIAEQRKTLAAHLVVGHWIAGVAARVADLLHLFSPTREPHADSVRDAFGVSAGELGVTVHRDATDQRSQARVVDAFISERIEGDVAVRQRGGYAVGHRMIGGLAAGRLPFGRIGADDLHGRIERVDINAINLG